MLLKLKKYKPRVAWIRSKLYAMGIRPKFGSIWYSPSLAYIYGYQDAEIKKAKERCFKQ